MKTTHLLFLLSLLIIKGYAQNSHNCSSHLRYNELLKTNPEFKTNQEQLETETTEFLKNKTNHKTTTATYIIPVVFHVIYANNSGNISNAQIIDQINILNKEFPRMQADTSLTPPVFKPFAAPFNVEFRLATIDPSGNCTNGIDRIYSSTSICSVNEDAIKSLSYWPSNKYLNIWLVESMHYDGSTTCNGGGYATFPGGTASLDGINIRGDLIGSIGTSATNPIWGNFMGRYLVHELGHWFNLRHIWGDAFCGTDLVADTPPAENYNSGCPSYPYNGMNQCGGNSDGEMFCNYMDYTNGTCLNMFTAGQVARMTAAINSTVSGRKNLWNPINLAATGTADPYSYPVNCTSTPDILPYTTTLLCAGDSIKFTDVSYGGKETSRTWNFFGQPSSSITDSIVYTHYNSPGTYNVAITINNLSDSKSKTFNNKIYVLDNNFNPNYTAPFTDSFENATTFNNDWVSVNKDNDATTWQNMSSTSYSGTQCLWINNFNNIAPSIDELISPAYDLSSVTTATLSFKLHYSAQTATDNDKLQVYSSSNCGKSWQLRYSKSGTSALKTVTPYYTTSHIPVAGSTEWRQENINLPNNWGTNPIRFKFAFTSGGGNNIFIDDININTPIVTGLNTQKSENDISLFPNPSSNEFFISYNLANNASLDIEVIDVLGKIVITQNNLKVLGGKNTYKTDTKNLTEGIYIVRVKQENKIIYTGKFIKQN